MQPNGHFAGEGDVFNLNMGISFYDGPPVSVESREGQREKHPAIGLVPLLEGGPFLSGGGGGPLDRHIAFSLATLSAFDIGSHTLPLINHRTVPSPLSFAVVECGCFAVTPPSGLRKSYSRLFLQMARISNNSPQRAIGNLDNNDKKSGLAPHWAIAFFSVNSASNNNNNYNDDDGGGGGGNNSSIINNVNKNNKNNNSNDINGNNASNNNSNSNNSNNNNNNDADSNSLFLRKILSRAFEDKSNVLRKIDTNGSILTPTTTSSTSNGFTISSPQVLHSSHILNLRSEDDDDNFTFYRKSPGLVPGRRTYHNSPSESNSVTSSPSTRTLLEPITIDSPESANSLLNHPLDQCLTPIPPSLWGSRQRHACKHADTFFTPSQVAGLTSDNQHHLHLHHIYHENSPLDPAIVFEPNPEFAGFSPCHETTLDCPSSSSSSPPPPSPPLLFDSPPPSPSSLSDSPSDSHSPPVDELITPCLEPVPPPVVQLQEQSEQEQLSGLQAIFCNTSSPTECDILAEHSCAALEADRQLPPHSSSSSFSSTSRPTDPASSHSEQEPSTPAPLDFESDLAMPKQRLSDSGASSRTRPELSRPTSTATTGSHSTLKAPSSPHSISRMFSTKIRGLLHTRDRRASSPLSPVAPMEAQLNSQKASSVSVPSSPRTVRPPVVHPVQTEIVVQTPTEDYGLIPIGNPFPQNGKDYTPSVVEPRSGHSSYMSMDSPTRTESTCQDSSTSTESTGIPSNRSSFRSLQEERRRSVSPESPITPDGDYRFNRATPAKTDTMDSIDYHYEDALDDSRSQEVPVFLDERSEVLSLPIPSVQIEAATPTVAMSKHSSHFSTAPSSRTAAGAAAGAAAGPPPVSRSRSASPVTRRAPSFAAASIREECGGRETPSFLAPRPAPIPIPSSGSVKPTMRPAEGGPKLLRSSTMSSRALAWKVPLSMTPGGRPEYSLRPSTATRPGTSFSTMSGRSMGSTRVPGSPTTTTRGGGGNISEVDETVALGGAQSPSVSTFNPEKSPSPPRGKPGSLMSASVPHEIAIPPAYDARSFRTAPVSPTATSEYSFTAGLSPKRIPDDMQMCPIVFHTEDSDADVCIPVFLPLPSPVMEPRRSRTVSLRHAFTRLNSHVNKRGTTTHITPDIISRPSAEPPATILEYDNPENTAPTGGRTRATSSGSQPSGSSFSRWKSVHTRSSSNPSNPPPPAYSPPVVPAMPTLAPGVPQPIALTDDEKSEIARMPGTIFLKTAIKNDGPDGELTIQEHRLKPRKGMQGSGPAGKCRFCRRGPFPNMWVCLDSCGFVMCRICANESVQGGEAELF
ncbi:hypothetical protein Q9L58_008389 [Maublancomyces gigas]|uniref:Uncharacterized protein n=1 Tax=Discina gigas TaxID=1032678 RepID=A0ABR3G9U2_9PEZI